MGTERTTTHLAERRRGPNRNAIGLAVLAAAFLTGGSRAVAEPPGGAVEGIRWEASVEAGLERSAQEGRPVLLCVNALENEGANNALATVHYRSAEWGAATRGFVCLVGNPEDHPSDGGRCKRYGNIPCATHRGALDLAMRLFGAELISPQHAILEPDGAVLWRKEFFSGDVTPGMLLTFFVEAAPRAAVVHAGLAREGKVDELANVALAKLPDAAATWIASGDPLAVPAIVSLVETGDDARRRVALVRSLAGISGASTSVLSASADETFRSPEDDRDLTEAWVETLARHPAAAPALARLILRTKDGTLRSQALAAITETAPDLAREARLSRGTRGGETRTPGDDVPLRVRRAEARAGLRPRVFPPLAEALESDAPGDVRGALLEASVEESRANGGRVWELLLSAREERVRIAAALAVLRGAAWETSNMAPVADRIVEALSDPVEGPDTRAEAVLRLGEDPGQDPDVWRQAILRKMRGGR